MKVLPGLVPRMKAAGINQSELARQLGISRTSVSLWTTNSCFPSAQLLPKIAKILGCSIDDLYTAPTILIPPGAEEDTKEFYGWRVQ